MSIMANVAAVFHWSPSEMRKMTPDELMQWHALAVERSGAGARNG